MPQRHLLAIFVPGFPALRYQFIHAFASKPPFATRTSSTVGDVSVPIPIMEPSGRIRATVSELAGVAITTIPFGEKTTRRGTSRMSQDTMFGHGNRSGVVMSIPTPLTVAAVTPLKKTTKSFSFFLLIEDGGDVIQGVEVRRRLLRQFAVFMIIGLSAVAKWFLHP